MNELDRALTEREAAAVIGVAPRTLSAWRVKGNGPRFQKISRRCVRYHKQDIAEWRAAQMRASTADADEAVQRGRASA